MVLSSRLLFASLALVQMPLCAGQGNVKFNHGRPPPRETEQQKRYNLIKKNRKRTPEDIYEAVGSNKPSTIKKFMDNSLLVDIDQQAEEHWGQTPLMYAVLNGMEKSVKYLLKIGADPSIPESGGYTPLHGAAYRGWPKVMKALLDHGLDPKDAMHEDGYTPLHRACWGREGENGHFEVAKLLIEAGVSPLQESKRGDKKGDDAIEICSNPRHQNGGYITELLIEKATEMGLDFETYDEEYYEKKQQKANEEEERRFREREQQERDEL